MYNGNKIEGNRAAIFLTTEYRKGFGQPANCPGGTVRISFRIIIPSRRACPKESQIKVNYLDHSDDKDDHQASHRHRNMQNKPTEPAPIQQKFSTEPTVEPVLNPGAPSLKSIALNGATPRRSVRP